MKRGDLVIFCSGAWIFKHAEQRYKNPGIIFVVHRATPARGPSAGVYWSDGKITTEHYSYLKPATVIK